MKIETIAQEDQQTKLIAELEPETLERFRRQAARKISQTTKIPGFRPGKAPYDLVRRMVGEDRLNQEAIDLLLDDVYPKILTEANINPSGPGKLEEIISMDPPKFVFLVPLPPEVKIEDYQSIRKEYSPEPITDEQVEKTIRRLQRSYATAEPVERAAQEGDMVSFKLSAKRTQPTEGKSDTLLYESPYQMVAGEEEDNEDGETFPYKGFTEELVGMSAGETKTYIHNFSDDSPYEDLRGTEAEFTIVVENVKEMKLSEVNDEFAQSLGEYQTVDELKKSIRQQLEQNYKQQYDQNYYDELIEELISRSTVKYPPHMLEEEIENFIKGVEHNLEHDKLDLETYLKMRELDRETFTEKEVKPAAEKRLVRSLVLEQFAKQESIEVKNEEIRSVYYAALQQMQQSPELKKLQTKNRQSSREMANSLAINTVNNIFNQRLMSRLKAIAIGQTEKEEEITAATDAEAVSESNGTAIESNDQANNKPEQILDTVTASEEAGTTSLTSTEETAPIDSVDGNK